MFRFIVRRVLQMILVFVATTFIVYALMFAAANDPVQALVGDRPVSPQLRAALTARYHLDDPFIVQYLRYLRELLHGDLGTQLSGRPVAGLLAQAWPYTLRLSALALLVIVVFGIGAGLVSGVRRGGVFDHATLILTLVIIGIPAFVLGFNLQYLFGVKWRVLPVTVGPDAGLTAYLLPAVILGSVALATAARLTRTAVVESLRADYVRTVTAIGLPRRRVIGVHVLRNSLIPVVTFLGVTIGELMAGSVVTERIFNIPGVGYQLYQGIHLQDGPTVAGIVSILVVVYLVCNLIVDLLYAALDPRIRDA
ncbi:ABC transporter permease [Rugosimonospora acidiphila]|uniref:ABC transporter permease n=1 Tax=Rugosimonospora acidiphila TaxID=556531 RepID=A0ABP9RJP1_9ACTN